MLLPSVPSSAEARLRFRFASEDESESGASSRCPSPNVLCLGLNLKETAVASFLEGESVGLVFSLRAYLKKSSASGSSPFPFFTSLTPLVVEEESFYTNELTDNKLPTNVGLTVKSSTSALNRFLSKRVPPPESIRKTSIGIGEILRFSTGFSFTIVGGRRVQVASSTHLEAGIHRAKCATPTDAVASERHSLITPERVGLGRNCVPFSSERLQ